MLKRKVAVAALGVVLLALPVEAYIDCETTTVFDSGGGCYYYTECTIYDADGRWAGTMKGPIQQCG